MTVHYEVEGPVAVVTIDRPDARNAVDRPTAEALVDAFTRFDTDDALAVAVLTGAQGTFCAGADLKAMSEPSGERINSLSPDGDGPMGPTRMSLTKPVIAAVEGHAVAGGLELALWCDLRVAAEGAVFGVFCRRWGVPLVDGGTVRLPRIIGQGPALDLILTGRAVRRRRGAASRPGDARRADGHRARRRGRAGDRARRTAAGVPAQRPRVGLRAMGSPPRRRVAARGRARDRHPARTRCHGRRRALRRRRRPPRHLRLLT